MCIYIYVYVHTGLRLPEVTSSNACTPEVAVAAQAPGARCDGSTEPGVIQGRHGGGEESFDTNCGLFWLNLGWIA